MRGVGPVNQAGPLCIYLACFITWGELAWLAGLARFVYIYRMFYYMRGVGPVNQAGRFVYIYRMFYYMRGVGSVNQAGPLCIYIVSFITWQLCRNPVCWGQLGSCNRLIPAMWAGKRLNACRYGRSFTLLCEQIRAEKPRFKTSFVCFVTVAKTNLHENGRWGS